MVDPELAPGPREEGTRFIGSVEESTRSLRETMPDKEGVYFFSRRT
jgi:hypothetical protein